MRFSNEQLRILANLATAYDNWMGALRAGGERPERLAWKSRGSNEYLYVIRDRDGNGTSLGPRSADTEARYAGYETRRTVFEEAQTRARASFAAMAEILRQYRALRLPQIDVMPGRILRAADRHGMLGSSLMVVGTTTMPAYEVEAITRFATGLDATIDCDLAWTGRSATVLALKSPTHSPILSMLKTVDETFVVNMERLFQARNAAAYEVEILLAPSVAAHYPPSESLRPVQMDEQEWLLRGHPVSHVVVDRENLPARIVAPDPRWMALHKLWLADKPERNAVKRPKDRLQGLALLTAVRENMPGYPLDAAFRAEVPDNLRRYLPPP